MSVCLASLHYTQGGVVYILNNTITLQVKQNLQNLTSCIGHSVILFLWSLIYIINFHSHALNYLYIKTDRVLLANPVIIIHENNELS
jgi:hypothetical protein